jgi:hypothetical protein
MALPILPEPEPRSETGEEGGEGCYQVLYQAVMWRDSSGYHYREVSEEGMTLCSRDTRTRQSMMLYLERGRL